MGQLTASYDAGTAAAPLVGDTIGVALQKMVVAQPDVEALVSRHQGVRLSYGELGTEVERVARGLLAVGIEIGDRVGIWSPTCAEWTLLQFACARDRSDPRQREPGVPAERARVRAPPLGRAAPRDRSVLQDLRLLGDARRRAGRAPQLEQVVTIDGEAAGGGEDDSSGRRCRRSGQRDPGRSVRYREAAARHRRPDQHPVHERHDGQSRRAPPSRITTS